MTYEEALAWLGEAGKRGSVPGLERIRDLLEELSHPEKDLSFVHIAGTNGKGSVAAFLTAVLSQCSYKVGSFTTPAVFAYEELFQIDGHKIPQEDLCLHLETVRAAVERMEADGKDLPTRFEIETALALVYFEAERCDIVIWEAGMGGALDATNVIPHKVVSVIPSIDLDHTEQLGQTVAEIAEQKAGIILEDRPVVYLVKDEEAREVIERTARARQSQTRPVQLDRFSLDPFMTLLPNGRMAQLFSYKNYAEAAVTMLGRYEAENAAVAIETLETLSDWGFYRVTKRAILAGLPLAQLPGRFELVRERPNVFLDGAHNPAAIRALLESLDYYFPSHRRTAVIGMFKDKDTETAADLVAGQFSQFFTVTAPGERGLDAEALAQKLRERDQKVTVMPSVRSAVEEAVRVTGPADAVAVFGSFSILKEAREGLNAKK